MSNNEEQPQSNLPGQSDWDTYWRGVSGGDSFGVGGVRRIEVARFWTELFTTGAEGRERPRLLDVAAGSGAVVSVALNLLGDDGVDITCVDYSPAAVESLAARFPQVSTCLADARDIPLEPADFDFVVSQFGVEYAGTTAFGAVAEFVREGGRLALLIHYRGGAIDKECRDSLHAVQRLRESQFIPLALDLVRAGDARVGGASADVYEFAKRAMMPAVLEMKKVLAEFGPQVAGGTVKKLFDDVKQINARIENYDLREVVGWLQRMDEEVAAYEGRMASMCESAIDGGQFASLRETLVADGFDIERADELVADDSGVPLAWALIAARPAIV